MSLFQTPILFLVFNRPENTEQVFKEIKKIKPKHLFIAADGPRDTVIGETEKCTEVRKIVSQVDWDCELKTLYREKNLGCKKAVSSGIDWFFENVEAGIILEDDCVPHTSFFGFCQHLLSYYRSDKRIMMICGTTYLPDKLNGTISDSYFFSNYYPIWGWATWKRAWQLYDVDMKAWDSLKEEQQLKWLFPSPVLADYYEEMFDMLKNGFDTWDIQWWFACIFNSGLSVVPKNNLISNIGITGTHSNTQGDFFTRTKTTSINADDLKHPQYVFPDKLLNETTYAVSHAQRNWKEIKLSHFSEDQLNFIVNSAPYSLIKKTMIERVRRKLR